MPPLQMREPANTYNMMTLGQAQALVRQVHDRVRVHGTDHGASAALAPQGHPDAPRQRMATGLIIDCTEPWYLFCPSTNRNS